MFDEAKRQIDETVSKAYIDGMNLAWECCKRFLNSDDKVCDKIFGVSGWADFLDQSPSEAIEKFKEYDEKHFNVPDNCKIEVGDEVYVPYLNEYATVIAIVSNNDGDFVRAIRCNGEALLCVKDTVNLTGNHCDSIVDLLKRLEKRNA
jgi:hypothetical protein